MSRLSAGLSAARTYVGVIPLNGAGAVPPRKLDGVLAAMRADNWHEAIRLAAKFPRLGPQGPAIMRAHEAIQRPDFQRQMAHEDFLAAYRWIIKASVDKLRDDRFAAFVVGDFRCKRGFYRNFTGATVEAFEDAGARYYNEAILVTAVGSLPIRAGKQFKAGRKLGKTHQNILVFCKGDPKKAAAACEGLSA